VLTHDSEFTTQARVATFAGGAPTAPHRGVHEDAIADPPPLNIRAHRLDLTRHIGAPYVREREIEAWNATSDPQIQVVQRRGPNPDSDLPRTDVGRWKFSHPHDFGPTMLVEICGFHGAQHTRTAV
jgi:hypothetical protein